MRFFIEVLVPTISNKQNPLSKFDRSRNSSLPMNSFFNTDSPFRLLIVIAQLSFNPKSSLSQPVAGFGGISTSTLGKFPILATGMSSLPTCTASTRK